jgi:hypothetical protein
MAGIPARYLAAPPHRPAAAGSPNVSIKPVRTRGGGRAGLAGCRAPGIIPGSLLLRSQSRVGGCGCRTPTSSAGGRSCWSPGRVTCGWARSAPTGTGGSRSTRRTAPDAEYQVAVNAESADRDPTTLTGLSRVSAGRGDDLREAAGGRRVAGEELCTEESAAAGKYPSDTNAQDVAAVPMGQHPEKPVGSIRRRQPCRVGHRRAAAIAGTSTASTAIAAFTASHTSTPPVTAVRHPASRTR